jgi:hypothetical protein
MKNFIFIFIISVFFTNCGQRCNLVKIEGEVVQIPVEFDGFSLTEISNITVYRIDKLNASLIDTLTMNQFLWSNKASSSGNFITDNGFFYTFGYFNSYLDNCDLVLSWPTGGDTLADFIIKKSHVETNDCHKGDPNVRIDKLSFKHKGMMISKNESIKITK